MELLSLVLIGGAMPIWAIIAVAALAIVFTAALVVLIVILLSAKNRNKADGAVIETKQANEGAALQDKKNADTDSFTDYKEENTLLAAELFAQAAQKNSYRNEFSTKEKDSEDKESAIKDETDIKAQESANASKQTETVTAKVSPLTQTDVKAEEESVTAAALDVNKEETKASEIEGFAKMSETINTAAQTVSTAKASATKSVTRAEATVGAAKSTVAAVKSTAVKSTAVKSTAAKSTAAKSTAVKSTAAKSTAAKSTAAAKAAPSNKPTVKSANGSDAAKSPAAKSSATAKSAAKKETEIKK